MRKIVRAMPCEWSAWRGRDSKDPVQRPTRCCQCVDAAADRRILLQRRRVMWLDTRVDDQRSFTAPVLLGCESADAVDVGRGIRACEGHPEEVVQRPRRELAVVGQ